MSSTKNKPLTPCEMYKVEFRGKVYPVVDYIYREPEVGIFNNTLIFARGEEIVWSCDFPTIDEDGEDWTAKVYGDNGKVIGKAKILLQK